VWHRGRRRRRGGSGCAASAGDGAAGEGSGRWRRLHRRANGDGSEGEGGGGCGGGGFGCGTASALAAVRLRHDHRPFSTDWRVLVGGVCSVATTELRLFVRVWLWCVRTGTGLKRRLLVWCERLSCLSESVVVTCIIVRVVEEQWRVWPKACVAFRVHTTADAKHDSYTMRSNHAATEPVQVAVTALLIERNQRPAHSPVAAL
jgi:hypothetical protein